MSKFTVLLVETGELLNVHNYQIDAKTGHEAFTIAARESFSDSNCGDVDFSEFSIDDYHCVAVFEGEQEIVYRSNW